MDKTRYEKLKLWMFSHNITLAALSNRLHITSQSAGCLIAKDRIPTKRHEQLLALGFPLELLPTPLDIPRGRRPKEPHFPGLDQENQKTKRESSNA